MPAGAGSLPVGTQLRNADQQAVPGDHRWEFVVIQGIRFPEGDQLPESVTGGDQFFPGSGSILTAVWGKACFRDRELCGAQFFPVDIQPQVVHDVPVLSRNTIQAIHHVHSVVVGELLESEGWFMDPADQAVSVELDKVEETSPDILLRLVYQILDDRQVTAVACPDSRSHAGGIPFFLYEYLTYRATISQSAVQNSRRFLLREFRKENDEASAQIVTNSIRQITVMDITMVFALLLNCLNVKLFSLL